MKIVASIGLGLTLTLSALTFSGLSASAVETQLPVSKPKLNVIKVDEREHCERVRHECRERHHEHEHEYRECVKSEGCEP